MAIAFEQIPADLRLPLFYAEVTPGNEPVAPNLRMCLIGFKNRASFAPGTAVENLPYLVMKQDATTLFGRGSMLEGMYIAARAQAPWAEIWAIAVPEDDEAIQAVGTITVAHDANKNHCGIAAVYISGRRAQVKILQTDTAATIATNLAAAANAAGTYVKASASGSVVTLTARWGGTSGNQIVVSLIGSHGRRAANTPEALIGRYFFNIVQPSGGAGEHPPSATYAVLDTYPFEAFVIPSTGDQQMTAAATFMDGIAGRWSPNKQQYGHMFACRIGDSSALVTFGDTYEDPHMTVLGVWKSINPSWEWASSVAGVAVAHWAAPPELSRPLQTIQLRGMYVGSDDDESFSPEERALLLNHGISTMHVNDDTTCAIDRLRTLRKSNAYGDPDESWADAITMFQAMYFVRDMRAAITNAFPRCALSDVDLGINGFTSAPQIRLVILHEYALLASLGLVENPDLFGQYLIVERNKIDRNRVDVLMRPDFVNQFRICAVLVETHLELDPTDPTLQAIAA